MSNKYTHLLKVSDISKKTKDCVAVTFDVLDTLSNIFTFKAGQYITIIKNLNGEEIRRSYSICSSPEEKKLTVAIKRLEGGKFSTFANEQLNVGDTLDVMPPSGNFILKKENIKNLVFFAAGSGITPILSHIKHILSQESDTSITLFYGNKNFESIIFREELEGIKNKYLTRIAIHHIFTKEKIGIPLMHGRIDNAKCKLLGKTLFIPENMDTFLLCGPNEMIFSVKDALLELGVPAAKIHFELFNTDGLKKAEISEINDPSFDQSNACEVTIQMDGDIFEFDLDFTGQNILDAAIANGADLPYSCKGGVCSTCKAKITNGEVKMDINYALEPDEIEAGYVLLCQSHPRSTSVYIDFDQK